MDEHLIITANHEAGHALMAYIVGWTISSIELEVQNGVIQRGVTNYDFGTDVSNNWTNLNRRVLCLMGGPIAQAMYENSNQINIDTLGQDGISIDNFLAHLDRQTKESFIQSAINTSATFLKISDNRNARQDIVNRLLADFRISKFNFLDIVTHHNVRQMKFN